MKYSTLGHDFIRDICSHELVARAAQPEQQVRWLSGILKSAGIADLLSIETFWQEFNTWLFNLSSREFIEILPVLRKAFKDYNSAEKRKIGSQVDKLSVLGQLKIAESAC